MGTQRYRSTESAGRPRYRGSPERSVGQGGECSENAPCTMVGDVMATVAAHLGDFGVMPTPTTSSGDARVKFALPDPQREKERSWYRECEPAMKSSLPACRLSTGAARQYRCRLRAHFED
jgi:hypothetical protein